MKDKFLSSAYVHANVCTCSTCKDEKPNTKLKIQKYLNIKLIIKKHLRLADFKSTPVLGKTFFMKKSLQRNQIVVQQKENYPALSSFFAKA